MTPLARLSLAVAATAGGPYTSTPVAYNGLLFGARNRGILFACDSDGKAGSKP